MSTASFIKDLETRRTIYQLSKQNFPISNQDVVKLVEDVVAATPSSFNNQTNRAVVIFGSHHDKLWGDIVYNALKAVVPESQWEASEQRVQGFNGAYGTVLFFEDTDVIKEFEGKFPPYAANFVTWADQSSGSAQISVWTGLSLLNVGANLQHYNELIEKQVASEFGVPKSWKLIGQLVFGAKVGEPLPKTTLSPKETIKVFQ